MKPGRPKRHMRPAFLSILDGNETLFYELDAKGHLVREQGKIKIHHTREEMPVLSSPASPIATGPQPATDDHAFITVDFASLEPVPQFDFEIPMDAIVSIDDF